MARERTKIIVLLGVVILAVALLIWLLKPKTDNADNPADSATVASTSVQPPQTTANSTSAMAGTDKGMPELAPSLRGTEIDCPLQVNKQGQLVLTIGIRSCFDYFFSSLGEKTEAQLMLDLSLIHI